MAEIAVQITAHGGLAMLHDDAVDLSEFGNVRVSRASHVEYSTGEWVRVSGCPVLAPRGWFVMSARRMEVIASGFKTRAEALAFEKQHYSPGGAGWPELMED